MFQREGGNSIDAHATRRCVSVFRTLYWIRFGQTEGQFERVTFGTKSAAACGVVCMRNNVYKESCEDTR